MVERLDLPRSSRLLSGRDFSRVFSNRRARDNALFRIHYAPGDQPRLGMAVSRRISRKAVERNRIRRQIRESFRLQRPHLTAGDYVVVPRPAAAGADRVRLRQALDDLWQRFGENQ